MLPSDSSHYQKVATSLIEEQNLLTVNTTLTNRSRVTLYPIPTAIAFWSYLASIEELPAALAGLLQKILQGHQFKEQREEKTESTKKQIVAALVGAVSEHVKIQMILGEIQILMCHHNFYIEESEGLCAIAADPYWLKDLFSSNKKTTALRRKGYQGVFKKINYQEEEEGKIYQIDALPWQDWLAIWEYFAHKGNTRALGILRSLAELSLPERISQKIREKQQLDKLQLSRTNERKTITTGSSIVVAKLADYLRNHRQSRNSISSGNPRDYCL